MDSRDQDHRRDPSAPQSIPLQTLNRTPDEWEQEQNGYSQHRRTLSERGRALLSRGGSNYAPLGHDEEDPTARRNAPAISTVNLVPPSTRSADPSPLADAPGFQQAIGGFSGLSFDPTASHSHDRSGSLHTIDTAGSHPNFLSPPDDDTSPLTTSNRLPPNAGGPPPSGQRHDRPYTRFLTPDGATAASDAHRDPYTVESGGRRPSMGHHIPIPRRKSLSPSAADGLHRAGTIVRNMSQRVVNLSNESEVVEKSIKRKSSLNQQHAATPSVPSIDVTQFGDSPLPTSPIEKKSPSPSTKPTDDVPWERRNNPLRGRSLGVFPADSPLRMRLCELLVHPATEPTIFVLIVVQTVLLTIDASQNVFTHPRETHWGQTWIDFALLALFCIYTAEIVVKVIVSGFLINPVEYSTINRQVGFRQAVVEKGLSYFAPQRQPSTKRPSTFGAPQPQQAGILRSFTTQPGVDQAPVWDPRQQARNRLAHRAFLRHSFNRVDFAAVVSFWISFIMGIFGLEAQYHVYVFKMLSCLRILRLLGLTSGTSVILRSLKKAAPLLVNVAFLIGFFWLLFAIIGVQSFKSSLRRVCVWVDPAGVQANFTQEFQFCGGYIDQNGHEKPWVFSDGTRGTSEHKGYLCPKNSICVEGENPYHGTVSFDNIVQSLELVFVIMTSNTFSDIMYYLTDSDYLAAALFFAGGLVIMALWLMNLLIAVITSSFQVIRDESKTSAFTAEETAPSNPEEDTETAEAPRVSTLKRMWDKTYYFWLGVVTFGIISQCLRSAHMSPHRRDFVDGAETAVTILLLVEILIRFAVDWRHFFRSKRNIADLLLAVITSIIQLPPIHDSTEAYSWLTIFQIMRIYRIVLAVPITRDLLVVVLRNGYGLANLILFVFLLCFLCALLATQLFRGELPQNSDGEMNDVTFSNIYNAFLGMYQILSSENWTAIMYSVTSVNNRFDTAWIGAAFFIIWYILSNFIVLNMFIAVIQESFDVSEDEKRMQQVKAFLQKKELGGSANGNLSLSSILKLGQATGRRKDPFEYGVATTEMLLKDAVVNDFLVDQAGASGAGASDDQAKTLRPAQTVNMAVSGGVLSGWWSKVKKISHREPNPFYSRLQFNTANEELDPSQMAKEVVNATERRKRAQREYLLKHPKYNVSLFIFKPHNSVRRICQRIVGPGRGERRIEGVEPSVPIWYSFSAFIYAAIVAMVLLACVTTPVFQKEYFKEHSFSVDNWFVFTDMGFALLFTVEAGIKVIADGLFWTPNAYFRGSWGFIDGIVLITLWINVISQFLNRGDVSRIVGAFKALRALRLLNVSDSARDTFHSLIIQGIWKLISAAFVSLSLLIPFAIYGLNMFSGKMESCNDGGSGIVNLNDCVNEYLSTPYNWDVLAPRQAANPFFDFDDFGDSIFTLFQIVSQEGWIDVMWAAESVTGIFQQPEPFASTGNALFFVAFNLLGAVFVLTLFVSVFMRNYTEQTGVAYLTTEQRSWLELRKLLRQVSPSKRPKSSNKRQTWEEWCYRRALRKNGRWQRSMTGLLVFHLALLCSEFYPSDSDWDLARDVIFFGLTLVYVANIVIRIIGLTWPRYRKSAWDLYALTSVSCTFITSILLFTNFNLRIYIQLHKLFLVSITLLLIPRNNQLDQLFKTAAASFTSIANLLATWFVLFLVYAIALTQTFGLTRFNENESGNINFRTVPKALILLFRTSSGEGWNQLMEDFASVTPPLCVVGNSYFDGDCGSPEWARALFITWNILSMYIFVNLFVSLIYESFSYVYQRSSGLSVISRDEIRRFKQAWSEFDPNGTGFVSKETFPRLLGELTGIFEMRVYDGDFTVGRLIEECSQPGPASHLPIEGDRKKTDIDLAKLNARLEELPIREIQRRRHRMNTFYEEVLVTSDPDHGINFTSLLMILAHYKVINESKSLRLEEFLRRRARLQRVEEAVRRNVVVGFFDTLYWTRRMRRAVANKRDSRMAQPPELSVPEIFVDDITSAERHDLTPAAHSPVELSPMQGTTSIDFGRSTTPPQDAIMRSRSNSIQLTPTPSPTRSSPQLSPRHLPADSVASTDFTASGPGSGTLFSPPPASPGGHSSDEARSRANSNVSAQDVMEALDNSVWGQSIRRSFTLRRPPPGSRQ